LAKLAEPRVYGRRGPAKPPLREFGVDPVSGKPVLAKDGKFGVYVTDGETNASLTRGDRLEYVTPERAFELLAVRRDADPSLKRKKAAKPAKKAAAKKVAKAPAKAAKKVAKKTVKKVAKKAAQKKSS
jgi:DNA topoisomerase-1